MKKYLVPTFTLVMLWFLPATLYAQNNEPLLPVEMMVDANRDGEMSFTDAATHDKDGTTTEKPYRFWLNDDQVVQTNSIAWSDPDPETIPVVTKDYSDSYIQDTRDLEDFTRLWINFKGLTRIVKGSGVELKLEWKPNDGSTNWPADAGNPGIKVYLAVEANGGRKYLEDETWAGQQFSNPYYRMLADVHRGTVATFPIRQNQDNDTLNYVWQNRLQNLSEINPYVYLLFEGSAEGKGQLVLTLHQGGQKLVEYPPLFLDIKDIKKMYVRGHTTPLPANFPFPYNQGSPPSFPYVAANSGALFIPYANVNYGLGDGSTGAESAQDLTFEKPPDEEKKCIVFVHGIDMNIPAYRCYSESGFKRLWWAGYKGRFCAFRWGTPLSDAGAIPRPDIFNDGEMRAWSYGPSLIGYVSYIQGQMSGARISVIGHSLGNAVVGSAFEQGLVVNSYVAMEAAVPLSCYFPPAGQGQADPLASSNMADLLAAETSKPTPNNYPEFGYRGFLRNLTNGIQGKVTAYQNNFDFWLATGRTAPIMRPIVDRVDWVSNQKDYKPNDLVGPKAYEFHPERTAGLQCVLGILGLNNDRLVQDPHEAMAYIARSRTRALGAELPSLNPRPPGWSAPVNMNTTYGFGTPRYDHSGQFQRNIQRMYSDENGTAFGTPFYKRLLQDLNMDQQ